MLLAVSAVLVFTAVGLLLLRPTVGIAFLFMVRPVIDLTWARPFVGSLNLPMILGVLVPLAILFHAIFNPGRDRAIGKMPLARPWIIFSAYVFFFASIIAVVEGWFSGLDVFFRHLNGIVGFYMIQAWYRSETDVRRLLLAMAAGGAVPMGIGLYQFVTGVQWVDAQVEGLTRYVGLYHDAFTVRLYMMQTLLALFTFAALQVRLNLLQASAIAIYGLGALVVLFRAYSKSAVLALILWGLIWVVAKRRYLTLAAAAALLVPVVGYFATEIAIEIERLFNKELSALSGTGDLRLTFQGRWFSWAELITEWQKAPLLAQLFGSGHKALDAHNDYIQLLIHGGLFGLLLYVTLIVLIGVRVARNALSRATALNIAAAMAVVMWLIDSIGLVPSSYPPYQWFVWGIVGLAVRVDQLGPRGAVSRPQLFRPVSYYASNAR